MGQLRVQARCRSGDRAGAELGMHLVQIDLAEGHLVGGVVEIVAEELEILFVHLAHQMHRQIVKEVFDEVQPLGPMAFGFLTLILPKA